MFGLHNQRGGEVEGRRPLRRSADDVEIGKSIELGAMEAAKFAFPFLVERYASPPGHAILSYLVRRRANIESRREDDAIERDMFAVGDYAICGDALDTAPVGIDQFDIGLVEDLQELVADRKSTRLNSSH